MFANLVFPRGAYLSGRLEDFRNPGHFVGKGWLRLEFASLTLPAGTFPLSAKVVSVPHYQVDADSRIRGRGHARRDAVEWAIPVLWPEKLITLPMRGPRPELKGETRILLRILDDVSIPTDAMASSSAAISMSASPKSISGESPSSDSRESQSMVSGLGPNSSEKAGPGASSSLPIRAFPRIRYGGVSIPAEKVELPLPSPVASDASQPVERSWRADKPTFLIGKDGRGYVATNYWWDSDQLVFVASDGTRQSLPLRQLDFEMTVRLNRERGVPFEIRSKNTEP
jgi:hypothetical protein